LDIVALDGDASSAFAVQSDLHVSRFEIAMDHSFLVCGFQCLADTLRNMECFLDRNRAVPQTVCKSVTLDQFQNEEACLIRFFEFVDPGDVRMIQRRKDFGFTLEPAHAICVTRELLGQDLDRHLSFQLQVAGTIHLAHSAFAEQCRDFM
jgi:hypothetical protein